MLRVAPREIAGARGRADRAVRGRAELRVPADPRRGPPVRRGRLTRCRQRPRAGGGVACRGRYGPVDMPARGEPVTTFQNLADFVALPRVTALRLSPDGSWLAAAVQNVSGEPAKYVTSIWRISTTGGGPPPVRLTRSAEGEGGPEFLPDGSLLFVSKRPGPPPGPDDGETGQDGAAQDQDQPALWLLPAGGGEAPQDRRPARRCHRHRRRDGTGTDHPGLTRAARHQRDRRRRQAQEGAQGRGRDGDPVRVGRAPVLGSRPRPRCAAPVRRRGVRAG